MKSITQNERIIRHLTDFGSITTWEAIQEYGVSYIIEKYYDDAKKYWIKKQMIKKKINEFDFDSKVNVIDVKDRDNRLKDKLKVEEY